MMEREETLESVDKSGAPVTRRLATPAAVMKVFDKLILADEADSKRRAVLQSMIDGNPPYKQQDLDDAGLGSTTNVNFMTMSANLNARVGAAHELFAEVPSLIEVYPAMPDPEDKEIMARCGIMQEEFTKMVEEWVGFLPMVDLVIRETDAYGIGPAMFRNEWDWRPHAFKRGNLLFDPKAKVVIDDNDLFLVRDEMTAGDLFSAIENEDEARLAGWKVTAVRDLLVQFYYNQDQGAGTDDKFQRSTWESLQQLRKNNDPDLQSREFEAIKVVHCLVREVSAGRKVTHTIQAEKQAEPVFLFEKPDQYERMSSALWWMPASYGDGYARSIRGVATWMARHDDLSNRYLCRVFDAGWLTSGMVLQPSTTLDLSRLQFVQHGPYTVLPPELKAVQSTFMPQVQQLIQLREVSEAVMRNNTGTYRQYDEGASDGGADRKTARQVVEETSKEAKFEKATIAFRYKQLDSLYREMWRRVLAPDYAKSSVDYPGKDAAKAFLDRCKARGVESSELVGKADKYLVSATRAVGMGSLGVKYDLTNQVLNARPLLDAQGQAMALRDWLAVRVGQRNVTRYAQPVSRDMVPTNELSIAVLENNDLMQGQQCQVGTDQLQKVHIGAHLQAVIVPVLQAAQRQQIADPSKALQALQAALPHLGAHLQLVAQDKAQGDYVKGISEILKQGEGVARQLQSAVEQIQRQQQAQAEQQQKKVQDAEKVLQDRELEAKIHEINTKANLEAMKQQSLNDMRQQKTDRQETIADRKAQADDERKGAVTAADIRRRDLVAAADVRRRDSQAQ